MIETPDKSEFNHFKGTAGYIASDALMEAVKALGMPMESWHVKSTSKASEGLYVYDTIQRLNDARFGDGDVGDIRAYIKLGPLGRTFKSEERHVLLIDEIDKADMEFPNDLLLELDEMRFTVMETGDEIAAKNRPVVIITSNNEKELPDAFLRRCIFHFIDFPNVELMKQIVDVHHPNLDAALLDQVLIKFYWLRGQNELRKKPSTSELVDWISALLRSGVTQSRLEAHIPFLGSLLKNEQDTESLLDYASKGGDLPRKWEDLGPKFNQ